jgi:hypothetical protein
MVECYVKAPGVQQLLPSTSMLLHLPATNPCALRPALPGFYSCREEGHGDWSIRCHRHSGAGAPAASDLCKPRRQSGSAVQVRTDEKTMAVGQSGSTSMYGLHQVPEAHPMHFWLKRDCRVADQHLMRCNVLATARAAAAAF